MSNVPQTRATSAPPLELPEPVGDGVFALPVQTIRTFEASIENIIAAVERSDFRAGDRLPSESELAQQLGISKPTLRQALRVLERSGLLVVKQGKSGGIFLKSDYLPLEEISRHIQAEEHSVLETLRARRLIEPPIAQEAIWVATADDLREIERTVEMLGVDDLSTNDVLRADMMFHRAVARASHNRVLDDALKVVYRNLAPVRGLFRETKEEVGQAYSIHREQLDAMMARDSRLLDEVLDRHFHFLEDRLAASLGRSWSELFGAPA